MSNKEAQLIEDIIEFLKTERELYGDFSPPDYSLKPEIAAKPPMEKKAQLNTETSDIDLKIQACDTLEELKIVCQQTEALKTDLEGTKLIFGEGNADADLILVGEAPGAEEDKQGVPFVGRAGKMLDKILEAAEFDRDEIYITNILKHRPPGNRNPLPEERKRSLPFLLRQIDIINPKIILSLGKVSVETLLNKNGSLKSMRGRFHPFQEKYELIATFHPAALLRNPNWKRPTWEDFKKLRKRYDELVKEG